ncbi:MAG: hypothetical protein DCC65_03485 [Planctomycetota bacterium]|nr:MAG: hypothetical protein DCC65_03485 [Planctomycetota bacterium]
MPLHPVPTLLLGLIVSAYWTYVGWMVWRVRRDAGHVGKVLVPVQLREKLMWVLWVPVIAGWGSTPLRVVVGLTTRFEVIVLPAAMAGSSAFLVIRWIASGIALACLALSVVTWRHMGEQWRMGVDPKQKVRLLIDGPFSKVRHPIYSLSILLMICSVIILPCPTMIVLAAIHISLMHIKARNEEKFLLETKGPSYAEYCRKTGRFVPYVRSGMPAHVPHMDGSETTPDAPIRGWKAGGQYPFRFNFFQQSMLRWDGLHPYNAVHAVRVLGPANVEALRAAAWDVCKAAELGELAINYFRTAYEYRPLQVVRVQELSPGRDGEARLAEVVTEEINTPFHGDVHHPIRWTVFNEEGGAAHYVVLCYHHAVSDAFGIERLLAAVLRRYLGLPPGEEDGAWTTRLTRLDRSLRPRTGVINHVIGQMRLSLRHREMRRVHKMPDERLGGDYTAVAVRTARADLMDRLAAVCERRGVGVNDALIAAFASAIAEQTPDRRTSRRRKYLAMATVVGARRNLPREEAADFGVCLSSIMAVLRRPDAPVAELVLDVTRQTRALKTNPRRAAAETNLRYFAIRWLWWLAAVRHNRRSYRRVFPICGGVSTVYVDQNRFADLGQRVTRYVRACPCGPVMPLLLGPTIYQGRLELGLTYRIASRTRAEAEAMLDGILSRLEELCADPSGGGEGASPRA